MNAKIRSQECSENSLIQRARQGNLDPFNLLVLKYQDMAYHHAFTLLRDPAQSDDATQEGFIKSFQNISSFRGGSFRAWILKIVTNAAYDLMRRAKRTPTQPLFLDDEYGEEIESSAWLADPNPSIQATLEHNELPREIYTLLDELPEVYRSVITLVDLYELDYVEAAQSLSIPIGTVKSRLARARMQMKKKMMGNLDLDKGLPVVSACLAV